MNRISMVADAHSAVLRLTKINAFLTAMNVVAAGTIAVTLANHRIAPEPAARVEARDIVTTRSAVYQVATRLPPLIHPDHVQGLGEDEALRAIAVSFK